MRDYRSEISSAMPAVQIVHYACGDFKQHPAEITCIGLWDYRSGHTETFSRTSRNERELLTDFVNYLGRTSRSIIVVWNGVDTTYGIPAIQERCRVVLGLPSLPIPPYQLIDLDHVFESEYGAQYAPHRKLTNIAKFNGVEMMDFVEGPDEVPFFQSQSWKTIENSVNRKVKMLDALLTLYVNGNLKVPNPTEPAFDVFLCHNSVDKPAVRDLAKALKRKGLVPWLDEWELQPGKPWQKELEKQLTSVRSAAVLVGEGGLGPWQDEEQMALLQEFHKRGCNVIPVLLQNAPKEPELPLFLKNRTWVDFRNPDTQPMDRLLWGITGKKPAF